MACYTPLKGWRATNGGISFQFTGSMGLPVTVPCGQCIGCRLEHSRRWAVRCMHEAQLYDPDDSYFATLTYRDEHLPKNNSLHKEHLTLFWKRYRKKYDTIRYYASGEYGETTHRPHYHALIFGHSLPDLVPYDDTLSTSDSLDALWGLGNCMVGALTFESAAYTARYITKKLTGPEGAAEYEAAGIIPPFSVMSRRPGIGGAWYDKFASDIYPSDQVVVRGNYVVKPPRYYDNILRKTNESLYNKIKNTRLETFSEKDVDLQSGFRLYQAHEVAVARLNQKQRPI